MTTNIGSTWNKWDLHIHTPDSLINGYTGDDAWDRFLNELEALPAEFKVLGINDYIFLDGYKKIIAAKSGGRLSNIDLILPVIELRLDKFGGSRSNLSRVNFHVIFSDKISVETIESQFLNALSQSYSLTPQKEALLQEGKWSGVPTIQSLIDLGQKVIDSVPEGERQHYDSPIEEGFNNHCVSYEKVIELLSTPYFEGQIMTAVGKTEWADIKWNNQSIAEKKSIINAADLVFISSDSAENCRDARLSLIESRVNDRLLDCSDAHHFAASTDKDRIGKCYTWVKSDTTFEGLRQAICQYDNRILISEERPIDPLLKISTVKLDFPEDTLISNEESESDFCFRGNNNTISFSPNLTCIIGGRGSGKSTLLNLFHEKTYPGENAFFVKNRLESQGHHISISDSITINEGDESLQVEFLQQNEIELFAADPNRFTHAIFGRLIKKDQNGYIVEAEEKAQNHIHQINQYIDRLEDKHDLQHDLKELKKELATNKRIITSLESDEYNGLTKELQTLSSANEALRAGEKRFNQYVNEITISSKLQQNASYTTQYDGVSTDLSKDVLDRISVYEKDTRIIEARSEAETNEPRIKELKKEIEVYLKSKGLTEENLTDAKNATERIAELEQKIIELNEGIDNIDSELSEFALIEDLETSYAQLISEQLAPVNTLLNQLGSHVKPIRLEYSFDATAASKVVHEHLADIIVNTYQGQRRLDSIRSAFSKIDFGNLPEHDEFLPLIDQNNKSGQNLHHYFSNCYVYELFKLFVRSKYIDVSKRKTIDVFYDEKPIESTSFGQRCTTAIVVLILIGNTPIIIDEPEAHLDSSLIAQYLVDILKQKKLERQIIFATHNANFVVNGDAELIHILDISAENQTIITSTTIENLEHRERLLALEGGVEAFKHRETRYGI